MDSIDKTTVVTNSIPKDIHTSFSGISVRAYLACIVKGELNGTKLSTFIMVPSGFVYAIIVVK